MKETDKLKILLDLHKQPKQNRVDFLKNQLDEFDLSKTNHSFNNIFDEFNNSIEVLNSKQLENLISETRESFNYASISRKLDIYHISFPYTDNIVIFLKKLNLLFSSTNESKSIIAGKFKFTKQNLLTIIKQGWVGDWDLNPVSLGTNSIKLSTNTTDVNSLKKHSLVAKIAKIEPIEYTDKIRYRVYISNPKILSF